MLTTLDHQSPPSPCQHKGPIVLLFGRLALASCTSEQFPSIPRSMAVVSHTCRQGRRDWKCNDIACKSTCSCRLISKKGSKLTAPSCWAGCLIKQAQAYLPEPLDQLCFLITRVGHVQRRILNGRLEKYLSASRLPGMLTTGLQFERLFLQLFNSSRKHVGVSKDQGHSIWIQKDGGAFI